MNYIDKFIKEAMDNLPDLLTGNSKEYEKELYLLYGKNENSNMVFSLKCKNLKRYILIIVVLISIITMLIIMSIFNNHSILSVDRNGQKYIERPTYDQGNISEKLIVSGNVAGDKVKKTVTINIKPEGANSTEGEKIVKKVNEQDKAISKLNSIIYQINKSDDAKIVYLPDKIEYMGNIVWDTDENNSILLTLFIGFMALISVYFKRYDEINKLKKLCNESIEEDLPEFLNKIVLLMNAGLVLSAAFEKIVKDYNSYVHKDKSYFYNQLMEINSKVKETNAPMVEEIKRFAERSKNREFMRITTVMSDNIHKGTELVNILQNESSFLWFQRKKQAEEKGRIAETKLTMPLALQLVVLIMITLAPAMIEM